MTASTWKRTSAGNSREAATATFKISSTDCLFSRMICAQNTKLLPHSTTTTQTFWIFCNRSCHAIRVPLSIHREGSEFSRGQDPLYSLRDRKESDQNFTTVHVNVELWYQVTCLLGQPWPAATQQNTFYFVLHHLSSLLSALHSETRKSETKLQRQNTETYQKLSQFQSTN